MRSRDCLNVKENFQYLKRFVKKYKQIFTFFAVALTFEHYIYSSVCEYVCGGGGLSKFGTRVLLGMLCRERGWEFSKLLLHDKYFLILEKKKKMNFTSPDMLFDTSVRPHSMLFDTSV